MSVDRRRLPGIWLADTGRHGAAAVRLAPAVLGEGERERAAGLRRPEERLAYTLAHTALRTLLAGVTGRAPRSLRFLREPCPCCGAPHGRPALEGGDVHFSISHSRTVVLLALARTPVGVDVQHTPSAESVARVVAKLHPRETTELRALRGADRIAAFSRVWTRKEAFLKGLGTGLVRGLSLDYVGTGENPAEGPEGWSVADVALPAGFSGAVATRMT